MQGPLVLGRLHRHRVRNVQRLGGRAGGLGQQIGQLRSVPLHGGRRPRSPPPAGSGGATRFPPAAKCRCRAIPPACRPDPLRPKREANLGGHCRAIRPDQRFIPPGLLPCRFSAASGRIAPKRSAAAASGGPTLEPGRGQPNIRRPDHWHRRVAPDGRRPPPRRAALPTVRRGELAAGKIRRGGFTRRSHGHFTAAKGKPAPLADCPQASHTGVATIRWELPIGRGPTRLQT